MLTTSILFLSHQKQQSLRKEPVNYMIACKTFPKGNMEIDLDLARQPEKVSS